jgi:hypothetical protein
VLLLGPGRSDVRADLLERLALRGGCHEDIEKAAGSFLQDTMNAQRVEMSERRMPDGFERVVHESIDTPRGGGSGM